MGTLAFRAEVLFIDALVGTIFLKRGQRLVELVGQRGFTFTEGDLSPN
jgi:hypothetical protein